MYHVSECWNPAAKAGWVSIAYSHWLAPADLTVCWGKFKQKYDLQAQSPPVKSAHGEQ